MKNTVFTGAATALVTPLNEKGIDFEDLPDDWECPLCGALKEDFVAEEVDDDEDDSI